MKNGAADEIQSQAVAAGLLKASQSALCGSLTFLLYARLALLCERLSKDLRGPNMPKPTDGLILISSFLVDNANICCEIKRILLYCFHCIR